MHARIWIFLSCILIIAFCAGGQRPAQAASLNISAPYYCLLDAGSGQVLAMRNGDSQRAVASTTKIMTGILAIEYCDSAEVALVSSHADNTAEYTIGLSRDQRIAVGELLKAALIKSANDAAVVLAEHVAGDEKLFGHLMTKKAFVLGAFNTHFINASGLPAAGSCSTAYELAIISRYAIANPSFLAIVSQQNAQFHHPAYRSPLSISNTNDLLGFYPGANGIKTGTTDAAGKCLVGSALRSGRELIAVVLHSGDRSGDCRKLLDYGFENMHPVKLIDRQSPFKEIHINGEPQWLTVFPAEDLLAWQGQLKNDTTKKVQMNYYWNPPVSQGVKVGFVEVYSNGKLLKRIDLIGGNEIKREPSRFNRMLREILGDKRNISSGKE